MDITQEDIEEKINSLTIEYREKLAQKDGPNYCKCIQETLEYYDAEAALREEAALKDDKAITKKKAPIRVFFYKNMTRKR